MVDSANVKSNLGQYQLVQQRLDSVRKDITKEVEQSLDDVADEVLIEAQDIIRAEAYDTGALHESGVVLTPPKEKSGSRERLSRTVSFGGRTRAGATRNAPSGIVDYAATVHDVGTGAGGQFTPVRYLTRALQEVQPKIAGRFRKALKDILR